MKTIGSLLAILLLCQGALSQNLERVEPPFWWAGMKHPTLQLLVYGEGIGQTLPSLDYPGVRIVDVHKVENPNYLFVNLELWEHVQPGSFEIVFQNEGKAPITYPYELKERAPGSAKRAGFDAADVMYLITPDRFANGNPDNDKVKGMREGPNRRDHYGRHGGDIQGLSDHLDYIADMGFTAIWLNPILENDMPRQSYHGYATTDYYKVDPRYGSNEEYVALAEAAQEKGIKMIMDMIANHCGSEHWWMKDPPLSDWINYEGNYVGTNHRRTTHQDPHAPESEKRGMVDGWFVSAMPDLNQRNPYMAEYLIQNSIWWVEYAHLAGIRQDTYPYPDADFMSDWTCRILKEYPHLNIVGEEWSPSPAIVSYWQQGKQNPNGYTSCLPSVMDFPLNIVLADALQYNGGPNHGQGWGQVYEILAHDFLYPDPYNLVIMPDNHDMSRIYTQLDEDYELYQLAIMFYLTTRGIPQIYYGTEILMSHPGTTGHGEIRSDFPGGWRGDKVNGFDGKGLTAQQKEAQENMKTLLNWRKNSSVVHQGKLMHYAPENDVYVYFRYTEDEAVMVALSRNQKEVELDLSRFAERLDGFATGVDVLRKVSFDLSAPLKVPARSGLILELE
jgi:glycosidase